MSAAFRQMILWASSDQEKLVRDPRRFDNGAHDPVGNVRWDGRIGDVIDPDGNTVRQREGVADTPLNCERVLVIDTPAPGTWEVRMTPTSRFWLTARAQSSLALSGAQFIEAEARHGRPARIEGEPIAGRPATLRVTLASPLARPTFHLVSLDAHPLQEIQLQSADQLEFTGSIDRPFTAGISRDGDRTGRVRSPRSANLAGSLPGRDNRSRAASR